MTKQKNRPRVKSYFWHFILSYLMILLLPMTTILITHYTAADILKKEILKTGSLTAEKAFSDFDQTLGQMLQTVMQVFYYGRVGALVNNESGSDDAYRLLEIKQYCASLLTNDMADIFLYHRASNTVLSASNSRMQSDYYFDTYLNGNATEEQAWQARLNSRNSRVLDLYYGKGMQPTLALYQSLPLNTVREPAITAAVVMHPATLRSLLAPSQMPEGSAILVFDQNGTPVLTTDPFFEDITLPEHYSEEQLYTGTTTGQEYLIRCYRSKITQCTYAYLVPTSVFWSRLHRLNWIVTVCLLLCFSGCLFLTVLLARRNYRPFQRLLGLIRRKTDQRFTSGTDEADFITTVFEQVLVEREGLSERMELEAVNLKEEFLFKLIQGMIQDPSELLRNCARYGIPTEKKVSVILLEAMEDTAGTEALRGAMENLIPHPLSIFATQTGANGIACILCAEEEPEEAEIQRLFSAFVSDFPTVSCGIGRFSALSHIHDSYIEAMQALEYRFVYGSGTVIFYSQIAGRSFQYQYQAVTQAEQILRRFVKENGGDADACFEAVYRRLLGDSPPTREMVSCFRHDLLRLMDQLLSDLQAARLQKECALLDRLIAAGSLAEFRQIFTEALHLLQNHNSSQKGKNEMVTRVLHHLRDNYPDSNLNVNALGDLVKISPSYLSKLFREDTGVSISEYLTGLRLLKAKQLLLETAQNLEEIAKQTGFLDSSSFVRIFKKAEGITPGNYRKLNGGENGADKDVGGM